MGHRSFLTVTQTPITAEMGYAEHTPFDEGHLKVSDIHDIQSAIRDIW